MRSCPLLKRGEPAAEIVRAAREESADLIVLTTHGAGGSQPEKLGRVAGEVLLQIVQLAGLMMKGLGADEVIDRTAGDVADALKSKHRDGVAAIIDTGSDAPSLAHLSEAVRKGGTVVSMKGAAAPDELAKRDVKGVNVMTQVTTERLETLAKLSADGKLKAPKIRAFPLDQAGEAFQLLGQVGDKLVVKI